MPAIQTPCPECGAARTYVVLSSLLETGWIVRRRKCAGCDYRWYTKQAPEEIVSPYQLVWKKSKVWSLQNDV